MSPQPVQAESSIEVNAAPEAVWALLMDLEAWPSWNPDVTSVVSSSTEPAPGVEFRWRAGRASITSVIEDVQPPRRISWHGRTMGIRAHHVYDLTPQQDRTLVRSVESWDGHLVRLLRGPAKRMLQRALDAGLEHLKAGAERGR